MEVDDVEDDDVEEEDRFQDRTIEMHMDMSQEFIRLRAVLCNFMRKFIRKKPETQRKPNSRGAPPGHSGRFLPSKLKVLETTGLSP